MMLLIIHLLCSRFCNLQFDILREKKRASNAIGGVAVLKSITNYSEPHNQQLENKPVCRPSEMTPNIQFGAYWPSFISYHIHLLVFWVQIPYPSNFTRRSSYFRIPC
ncbi:hypothetical protein BJ165DRAFT_992948 [Panaeolus papilionaceus]|nr:hypothetical protein BJ165DRAFT_992948 [Panaeolus papilionaceus]